MFGRRSITSGESVPLTADASGALYVNIGLLAGELQQFNRIGAGAIVNYTPVTGDIVVKPSTGLLYGVVCLTAGILAGVYDNASAASGQPLIPSQNLAAGASFYFGGMGVVAVNGIFADWTSGSFLVLWV